LLFNLDCVAQQDSDVCKCVNAQSFVAVLLVVNFIINVAETEVQHMETEMRNTFDIIDHSFTIFYVLELFLNLFVNWFWPFARNGWSLFDTLAVTSSVVGALLSTFTSKDAANSLSIIRSIRMYVTLFELLPRYAPWVESGDYDSPN
jgi:hypothetical protein